MKEWTPISPEHVEIIELPMSVEVASGLWHGLNQRLIEEGRRQGLVGLVFEQPKPILNPDEQRLYEMLTKRLTYEAAMCSIEYREKS